MNNLYHLLIFLCLFGSISANASENKASGLPQLDFNTYPSLIFWSILSLLILYFIISLLIMPKISLILNNREQNIQNNLIKAKSIKEESDTIIDKLYKEQDEARKKARDMLDETIIQSKSENENKQNEITNKMNTKIDNAIISLNKEKNIRLLELLENANTYSEMIISKVIGFEVNKNKLKAIHKTVSAKIIKENQNGI